jgi:glycosyltransferase involved in cell wall biosynthesis
VEDYCTFLGRALVRRGVELKKARVNWVDDGWMQALLRLWRESRGWHETWVFLQYTALGWSRRGFPFGALVAIAILRLRGAHCAVMFHEPFGLGGRRMIDRVRGACQTWVVRILYRRAEKSIFPVPLETINWLPPGETRSTFIPIGGNIPERPMERQATNERNGIGKTIAVFCLSDPPHRQREVDEISYAVRAAATSSAKLRVVFLGKGTAEAQQEIAHAFKDIPVEVSNLGLQPADEVSRALASSDAMLCVRGRLYLRRGSAIAGIACGLPVVGYGDASNIFPINEAGLRLAPYGSRDALAGALAQVLNDSRLREQLRARSRQAQQRYFSWDVIAEKMHQALNENRASA